MPVPIQSQIYNPVTGVFGTGQMRVFGAGASGIWSVPAGVGKCRVRMWGGGGNTGCGGGFSMRTIYDLSGVTEVVVSVAGIGGTSSFGSYCSATGGASTTPGTGIGGDVNSSAGSGIGSGVGTLFGTGGGSGSPGSSGGVSNNQNGLLGGSNTTTFGNSGLNSMFSIDFIGCGGGGSTAQGSNGGGGTTGGYPGGGGSTGSGAPGMVIVEW